MKGKELKREQKMGCWIYWKACYSNYGNNESWVTLAPWNDSWLDQGPTKKASAIGIEWKTKQNETKQTNKKEQNKKTKVNIL